MKFSRKSCLCFLVCLSSVERYSSKESSLIARPLAPGHWQRQLLIPGALPAVTWAESSSSLTHVTLASRFPATNAAFSTSAFALITYPAWFTCSICLYTNMPGILIWKISIMRKIREHTPSTKVSIDF